MIRQKVDYGKYRYSQKEILKYIGESAALCGAVDYLFYQTPWVMLLVVPVSVFFLKWKKKQMIRERKRRLNYQFRDALNSMSVAVQAGYSVENAVSACVRDLEQLYPKNEDIVAEFRYIETQQRVSVPVEELFLDLGQRCKVEDIENFASVLYTAKRSGGDLGNVIQKVARMLGDKIDVKKEIEATLAAKKSEQMIMSLMPAGIILYLQLASPGFSGYSLRKSIWNLYNDSLPCSIWSCLLDGEKNCGNRGVVDVAPYCHFCYIIAFDRMQYFRLDPCRKHWYGKRQKDVSCGCSCRKYNRRTADLDKRWRTGI